MKHRKEKVSSSEDSDSTNKIRYSNGLVEDSERESSPPPRIEKISKSSKKKPSKKTTTDDIVDCLEKFKRDHPDLKKFKMTDCMSDSDDEISIVEIPNNVDPELLLDKQINFQGKTKLKINNVKYVMKPCQDIEESLLLLTKKKRFIRPMARLKLQEYIKDKQKNIEIDNSTTEDASQKNRLLPEKLKNRHPIFGSDYKKKIELDDQTKNRLNSFENDDEKPKKRKKKKQSEKVEEHDSGGGSHEDREEIIFKLLRESMSEIMPDKKKRKIKEEIVDESTDLTMSDSSDKKSKKRKNKTDNSTVNGIDKKESLIQKLVKDKSLLIGADPSIHELKKKKNKSSHIINSTAVPDNNPDFEIDVSRIAPLEKNKTKKKKIKQEIIEDDVEATPPSPSPPPVKKSKKIKKEPTEVENSLILDVLNTAKAKLNSPKQKKIKL